MKKLIAIVTLLGITAVNTIAETKTLIVKHDGTKSLEIKEGQVATVLFWGFTTLYINTFWE